MSKRKSMHESGSMDDDSSSLQISGTPVPRSPLPAKRRKSPHTDSQSPDRAPKAPCAKRLITPEKEITMKILLPNGTSFQFSVDAAQLHSVESMFELVKRKTSDRLPELTGGRPFKWGSSVKLQNHRGQDIDQEKLDYMTTLFQTDRTVLLLVNDGRPEPSYERKNMHDITPKWEILESLPQGYTMATALADHVDNAFQALSNNPEGREHRKVSVQLSPDQITISDTGPGMDAIEIAKWGTVGSSKHRKEHSKGVGGEAPFLNPYFGKYGSGGVAAAFHLGKSVTVSSKTKDSELVAILQLELQKKDDQEDGSVWRAPGGLRQPTKEERELCPHGSFTRVEITELKPQYSIADSIAGNELNCWKVDNATRLLKETYFPYVQFDPWDADGSSSETIFPVEFQVNGVDLLDVGDCETAISNTHSCNGDEAEANARVTCQYFPNLQGKETLEKVLKILNSLEPESRSITVENMSRVSLRWLGRLLPEVKWPIFPFMVPPAKREQRSLGVWAKRVRAFVDTDAGFHPVMSKTQLQTDQPFVVALRNIGAINLDKTSASDVKVSIQCEQKEVKPLQLANLYQKWLKDMHIKYDQEFIFPFPEETKYIFLDHEMRSKDLGVGDSKCIMVHTHLKVSEGDYEIKDSDPIFFKLPKGSGLRADKYVTLEYFYHDSFEKEGFQMNFFCRGIEVDASEGCKITMSNGNYILELNRSEWFPWTLLTTGQRLDASAWKKKKEELFNKSPGSVEVLNQEDTGMFELWEAFPDDMSNFEAGYALPKNFLVVVRPKKGSRATKQGFIVPEPMDIKLEVKHSGEASISHSNDDHGVLWRSKAQSTVKNGIKGVYVFSTEFSEVNHLVKPGTYTFRFELESEKYKDVEPALYSIVIAPSKITAKWTLCNHLSGCMLADHENGKDEKQTLVIRLNERVKDHLALQKYDQYGNKQAFEAPMTLDLAVVTLKGESLVMQTTAKASKIASSQDSHRLLVDDVVFANGSLTELGSTHDALLRVHLAEKQQADIKCTVFAGAIVVLEVISSEPPIQMDCTSFQDDLRPGEVIKKLTLQGMDEFRNKVEKGRKLDVILDGVDFQDSCGFKRLLDENGILQLGGLLKVTRHYNSTGSITFQSEDGIIVRTINFNTIKRRLVANQVPTEAYVGRQLQGISIMMVDEFDNVDTSINAIHESVTVDWLHGVTYRLIEGACLLPNIQMPEKSGSWTGHVSFSGDPSLCVSLTGVDMLYLGAGKENLYLCQETFECHNFGELVRKDHLVVKKRLVCLHELQVQLKQAIACSLGPPREPAILKAQSGVAFTVPFCVYDDMLQPAVLTEPMKATIDIKVKAKDPGDESRPIFRHVVHRKDIKESRTVDGQGYEAVVVISGSVGTYQITLRDTCGNLEGQVETTCSLEHGHIARLVPAQSDGTQGQSPLKPLTLLEVKRCSSMPRLTVTLLDSADNLCSSCEQRVVRMKVLDCSEWNVTTAEVIGGVACFECSPLELPVDSYQVSVELESLPEDFYSLYEQVAPITAQFSLKVCHGNYPSALMLLSPTTVSVSLTEAIQYLPKMTVFVQSADGMRLQSRPTVGLRLLGDSSISPDPKEYFGTFVESCYTQIKPLAEREEGGTLVESSVAQIEPLAMRKEGLPPGGARVVSLGPVRYDFSQVCVPSVAGTYVMQFFVRETDLPSQPHHLIVRHGPPARLEIVQREPGQEMELLQVNLLDRYGNTCEGAYGLEVALELALSKEFPGTPGLGQCDVYGKTAATVKKGKADFGVFQLSQGMPGMYTLKVFETDNSPNSPASLTPAEASIFISQGNVSDTIQQQCKKAQTLATDYTKCLRSIERGENAIQQKTAVKRSLEEQIRKMKVDVSRKEDEINSLRRKQEEAHDDEIIQTELNQPLRTERDVVDGIRRYAGRGDSDFASALLAAQSEGNYLSPQSPNPAARDVLGLVLMLGRVESESLNRALSDFLGASSLLLVICRTQIGVRALEEYSEDGIIDERKGLFGFGRRRGYKLKGQYDVLTLKDISPYRRNNGPAVDTNHPQRLLNIDPPMLPSRQPPLGFLGYAVNLVHLTSEHLQIRAASQGQEVGLRESLFFNLLRLLQVYDTRDHLVSAKDRLKFNFTGGISLDGGKILTNMRQRLGKRSDGIPLRFGTVPLEEREAMSLLPPACHAFERSMNVKLMSKELETYHDSLATMKQTLSANIKALEYCKKLVEKTKSSQVEITDKNERTQAEISELMKMKKTITAKNTSGIRTLENGSGSQDNDTEKMRAFMM